MHVLGLIAVLAVIGVLGVQFFSPLFSNHSMHMRRMHFIDHKNAIIGEQIVRGDYACCLEKPCTYCIEKDPKHGPGATCNCLEDVVTGKHPCGECIGEIMEGHGNPYLSAYFASAIADEMGEQHLDSLKQMMAEKYDIPVNEQV